MKKSLRTLLAAMVFMFAALGFVSTKSDAATPMLQITNLVQTEAGRNSATMQWNPVAYGSGVYYRLVWGMSATSLTGYKDVYGTDTTLYDLTPGQTYYVAIVAYADSDRTQPVAQSQVIPVSSALDEVKNLRQVNATTTSVTLSWSPVVGAQAYYVYRYDGYNQYAKVAQVSGTTATIGNLAPSTQYRYFVIGVKQLTGLIASNDWTQYSVKTVPAKCYPAKMTSFYSAINVAYFGWNYNNNSDGYQFQLMNYKGKVLYSTDTTSSSVRMDPFAKNVFTKSRVRAYVTVNGKKIYGAWSDFTYNASSSSVKTIRSANKKKITVKWKKIQGCTDYTVYISKKQDSGYKKVKTLSSKKKSCTITKIGKKKLKKNQTYYVRVVYRIKVGKSKVASQVRAQGTVY